MSYLASETKLGGLYQRPKKGGEMFYAKVEQNSIPNALKNDIIIIDGAESEIIFFASTTKAVKNQICGLIMVSPQKELKKIQADFYYQDTCVVRRFENKWITINGLFATITRTVLKDMTEDDFFIIPGGTGLYRKLHPGFVINLKNGIISPTSSLDDMDTLIVEAEFYAD